VTLPPPSTPIVEALDSLHLTADERAACLALTGVRTLGDLSVVVSRGAFKDTALEDKLAKVLGVAGPKPRDIISEAAKD